MIEGTQEGTDGRVDYEAAVLRTAAAIRDLLSDGCAHPWRDCIDAARDFTGGRWGAASDLAWAALTRVLNTPVVWSGPKGARMIAIVQVGAASAVPCPSCGAAAGKPCVNLNSTTGKPKLWPHAQREAAAVELAMVA